MVDETTVFGSEVTAITLTASFGWDGVTVSESFAGEGTEESPYALSSGADLAFLAAGVNGGNAFSGKYFVLTKNINLNFKAWTSIGNAADKTFSGIFDGKNFSVENVTAAFIGFASGTTVKNLTLSVKIDTTATVGGLITKTQGTACTIENVTVKGSVKGGAANVAGLIGNAAGATTIKNCKNYANVTSTCTVSLAFVGGIAGLPRKAANSYVANCKNFGNVTASAQVGGIAGASRVKVENSYCLETALINGEAASTLTLYGIKTSVGGKIVTASIVGQIDDKNGTADCGELVNCGLCDASGNAISEN